MKTILANLKANNIASELLNTKQLKEKYNFNFSESVKGLLEETGGILLASKCLQAIQVLTRHDRKKVTQKENE